MGDKIVKVEPRDAGKKNSDIVESVSGGSTVRLDQDSFVCYWNDSKFPEETLVCDNGVTYECQMGKWVKLQDPC